MFPSKKIFITLLTALLILGALYYATRTKEEAIEAPFGVTREQAEILAIDTDNDFLKDWEEALWKTDPLNSDTDGDGTVDGEEIKAGRNPLVAGPNDPFDEETIATKINAVTEDDLTETDKMGRMLFAAYLGAKKNGGDTSVQVFQNFVSETLANPDASLPLRTFTEGELRVIVNENKDSIRSYGNNLAHALTKKPEVELEHELLILDRAIQNDDQSELENLTPLISEYKRIQNDLLAMSVPKSALPLHLALLNATEGVVNAIEGMKLIFTDPIKSASVVSKHPDASTLFVSTVEVDFKSYFQSKKVSFKQVEDGWKLWGGI